MARPREENPKYKHPEYSCFRAAKYRCTNSNCRNYPAYGGRGVEFRFASYDELLHDIGRRPSSRHSIDRIDNDGHYEPGNVRWALKEQQANNTRQNTTVRYMGEEKTISQWARDRSLKANTICCRLRRGWSVGRALGFSSAD